MFIIAICIVILLGITGCADTVSDSQNDVDSENVSYVSEVSSLDETEESHPDENISGEISSEPGEDSQVPSALIPSVMIDGTIYYLSQGYPISDQEVDLDQISYTESEVPLNTFPEKDGESNYAPAGTAYVKHGNGYALKVDEYGWTLFLTWEDRLAEE